MGLLDVFNSEEGQLGLGLLAAGGPRADGAGFGQRMAEGSNYLQAWKLAKGREEMQKAQIAEQMAQAEDRKAKQQQYQSSQQRDAQFQQALQQRVPPAELARYFPEKVELIQKLAGARNFGRDEVARTAEIEGPGGSKVIQGYSKYGDEVGQGANGYVAPQGVNLGGSYTFAKPVAGQSFQITQDPNSIASNAITLRGQNMTDARARERLEMDRANAGDGGKAPAGYRWKPDGTGLEPIPGGPASKAAQATEGERKAATLYQRLEGSQAQYESAMNADKGAEKPGLLQNGLRAVGADSLANTLTGERRQQVEAAQLDMLDAALTLGTGAAYTKEQLEGYRRSYFPQIGDGEKTIKDKKTRLDNVISAAKLAAGRAASSVEHPPGARNGGASGDSGGGQKTPPKPMKGMVRNGYRFKGGDAGLESNWEKM